MVKQVKTAARKPLPNKILSLSDAGHWADAAHRQGLTIVATNGCYDLLHYGHVRHLEQAARLGDRLIVGLNSDRSVRQLKGPPRPLVPEKQRACMLAALACVDAVVIFPGRRALPFLRAVRPNIYTKGGDYRPESLDPAERRLLTTQGAQIRILPLTRAFSTTRLIKKIRALQ